MREVETRGAARLGSGLDRGAEMLRAEASPTLGDADESTPRDIYSLYLRTLAALVDAPEPGTPPLFGGDAWQAVPMPAPLDQAILRKAAVERSESGMMTFSIGRDDLPTAKATWPGVDWLCVMAGASRRQRGTTITWSTPQAFVAAAVAARTERQQFVDALRERLVANGCLAAAEAKPLDRQVEVHARDLRQDQRIPLPPIPRAR